MFGFKKTISVCTHNGSFHADEVFACATLSIWADKNGYKLKIRRSRDPEIIEKSDIVVDVGMVYDPENGRFDHHQKGGAGTRPNGIPYASFGLVWKHYGEMICDSAEVASIIDNKLVVPVDAKDNGVTIIKSVYPGVEEYSITRDIIVAFRKSWKDKLSQNDVNFVEILNFAKTILLKEIDSQTALLEGKDMFIKMIEMYGANEITVIDKDVPWEELTATKYPQIKYMIYPEPETDSWCIETPRDNVYMYETNRVLFPDNWRGLRDEYLVKVSGVKDAIFCHKGGFFAVAKTKEGAIEMAKKSLQEAKK